MFAIETAKMSSKGQMVMPDSFRKHYGWGPGSSLLLIATSDSVVVQSLPEPDKTSIDRAVSEAKAITAKLEDRLRKARASLEAARKIGLSLPDDIENGPARRMALAEKFA